MVCLLPCDNLEQTNNSKISFSSTKIKSIKIFLKVFQSIIYIFFRITGILQNLLRKILLKSIEKQS